MLACFTFIALTCLSFQVLRITTSKSDVLYLFSFEAISMYVIRNVNKLNLIRLLGRGGAEPTLQGVCLNDASVARTLWRGWKGG